ncbi:hypothetical protein [Streptomyces sp. NPDC018610]|uniref:hypothetical protein n=1 Tax=Streptomyces sp. NPDC018610 TaxID=3365049 RepID=UPI0037BC1A67
MTGTVRSYLSLRETSTGRRGRIDWLGNAQNSGTALSIGVFFSLMISGIAASLPAALGYGLRAHGVPAGAAGQAASLPPVSTLFATFLGDNPIEHLLAAGGTLDHLSAQQRRTLTGHAFFPQLVSGPFHHGLTVVFGVAAGMALIAASASALRGRHRLPDEPDRGRAPLPGGATAGAPSVPTSTPPANAPAGPASSARTPAAQRAVPGRTPPREPPGRTPTGPPLDERGPR